MGINNTTTSFVRLKPRLLLLAFTLKQSLLYYQPIIDRIKRMKERYKDDRFYDERQEFGPVAIRNFREVVDQYTYVRYVARFGDRAQRHELTSNQRPKLEEAEFSSLKKQLIEAMRGSGEEALFDDEQNAQIVARFLLADLLEEEFL